MQNSDRLAEQILQMEMSQSNVQTVAALQQAAAAGKANLKANDIEDVDLVLDEIAEQNDQMVQITEALGQSTIGGIDEDDLEAELAVRCACWVCWARWALHGLLCGHVVECLWCGNGRMGLIRCLCVAARASFLHNIGSSVCVAEC